MFRLSYFAVALALCCTLTLNAPAQRSAFRPNTPTQPDAPAVPETYSEEETAEEAAEAASTPDAILQQMDLSERISQLMLATMTGQQAPSVDDLSYLKAYTPAGVVVDRILKPSHAAAYVGKLRGVEQLTGIPLWVGANIHTLTRGLRGKPSGFVQMPSILSVAAADDPEIARRFGSLVGKHLRTMGFNLHLGPSLTLAPTLDDARGSIYRFGHDAGAAARAAGPIFEALHTQDLMAMPMGFPGGGANRSAADSPAVLLTPPTLLHDTVLLPYKQAIDAGVRLMHVGNVYVPTLEDKSRPASQSSTVMQQLLRGDLGFDGVIVAGPLDHSDVLDNVSPSEAAIRALQAGADILYWRSPPAMVMHVVDRIEAVVKSGALSESLINAAVLRVLTLKSEGLPDHNELSRDDMVQLERKRDVSEEVFEIERQGITLIQNRDQVLPLSKERSMPIGVTGVVDVEDFHEAMEKYVKPISQQNIGTALHMQRIGDFEIERLTKHIRGIRTVVCVFTEEIRIPGQIKLIRALKDKGAAVVVVHMGNPDNVKHLSEADAIVLAYCSSAMYSQTLAAMAEVLFGESPLSIVALDTDLTGIAGESRLYDALEVVRAPAGRLPVDLGTRFPAGLGIPYDPTDALKNVEWQFGDGRSVRKTSTEHTFKEPGRYPVTLTTTDVRGFTDTHTFYMSVSE